MTAPDTNQTKPRADSPNPEPQDGERKPFGGGGGRKKDGEIALFGGELVNRERLAKLLGVPAGRVSAWTRLPDGLPFMRLPSADARRKGQRLLFDVAKVREWLERRGSVQRNPTHRVKRAR